MTYATLKTDIKDFLNRSSLADATVESFVRGAEAYIHHGLGQLVEPLRHSSMETAVDIVLDAQYEDLPTGHLETKRLYVDSSPKRFLDLVSPEHIWSTYSGSYTGVPDVFAVEGSQYLFGPAPDGTYTLKCLYLKAFDALTDDADTNWLLTNSPDTYLYGALRKAAVYFRDAELQGIAEREFAQLITGLNMADKRKKHSGSQWATRVDGPTP